ncbi:PD-(D/E)XK nuclease family protein [Archangium violaceum]
MPSLDAPTNSPSVIAGVIQRLSVLQLKRHKLCPRAWFFQKVMRIPEPTTGAQQVGTEGHAQVVRARRPVTLVPVQREADLDPLTIATRDAALEDAVAVVASAHDREPRAMGAPRRGALGPL